jgi:hypothetical protein
MRSGLRHTLKHLYARPTNAQSSVSTALLKLPKHSYKIECLDSSVSIIYTFGPRITAWFDQPQLIQITYQYPNFRLSYVQTSKYRTDMATIEHTINGGTAQITYQITCKFE